MYCTVADDSARHFTNNYLLAQILEQGLFDKGHLNPGIVEMGKHVFVESSNALPQSGTILTLYAGFDIQMDLCDWYRFKDAWSGWRAWQHKEIGKYFTIHSLDFKVVLTRKQEEWLKGEIFVKSPQFDSLYEKRYSQP